MDCSYSQTYTGNEVPSPKFLPIIGRNVAAAAMVVRDLQPGSSTCESLAKLLVEPSWSWHGTVQGQFLLYGGFVERVAVRYSSPKNIT